jgi:hypothetical protein
MEQHHRRDRGYHGAASNDLTGSFACFGPDTRPPLAHDLAAHTLFKEGTHVCIPRTTRTLAVRAAFLGMAVPYHLPITCERFSDTAGGDACQRRKSLVQSSKLRHPFTPGILRSRRRRWTRVGGLLEMLR